LLWVVLLFGAFMAFGNDRAEADTALASWYGPGFHGQLTASGEVYNAYGYSAAHKTLPLGTQLTVSYAGRSVDVVVNDRGPYSGGRELDLSQGAAEYLGLTRAGVDYVNYSVGRGYGAGYAAEEASGYSSGRGGYGGGYGAQRADYGQSDYGQSDYGGGSYVVQSGDTLSGIAYELGTTVDALMAANGLTDPNVVYAGQTLVY
jgi:rare lipoprotein A